MVEGRELRLGVRLFHQRGGVRPGGSRWDERAVLTGRPLLTPIPLYSAGLTVLSHPRLAGEIMDGNG